MVDAPAPAPAKAPSAPSNAQVSSKDVAEFTALKKSLGHIDSWDLSGDSWDKVMMKFTEVAKPTQASAFLNALE
jgi:hypothetical protein